MKKLIIGVFLVLSLLAFIPFQGKIDVIKESSLAEVQEILGMSFDAKKPNMKVKGVSALVGQDIIKNGFSKRSGQKKSRRQSKHFVCRPAVERFVGFSMRQAKSLCNCYTIITYAHLFISIFFKSVGQSGN